MADYKFIPDATPTDKVLFALVMVILCASLGWAGFSIITWAMSGGA